MSEALCARCGGTGWYMTRDLEAGIDVATRCTCVADHYQDKLRERSGIPTKYANCTFDTFIHPPEAENPSTAGALRHLVFVMKRYADEYSPLTKDPRGLLLWGANGIGKTHLAVAALRVILERGFEVRFINYQELLKKIREGYDQPFGSSYAEAALRPIADAEVLLLDDLGANRVSDWVEDTITEIISQRHDNERAVIVTTNYSPLPERDRRVPTLADRIGERATSRLREMCRLLAMPDLPDYRGGGRR